MDRRSDLLGTRERRLMTAPMQVRADGDDTLVVEGYASVFESPYDIWGGPERGGFTEIVERGAFDKTLASNADVPLLLNHTGMPLARTKSGTLQLSTDRHGLKMRAELDRRDPEVQSLGVKLERGDMDEMSFAFYTIREKWNDEKAERRLTELSIHKGDVSIVNYGANPATSVGIADAIRALAEADDTQLAAARADLDRAELESAQRHLGAYLRAQRGAEKKTTSLAAARAVIEGLA
jgi:HK97 family phage prohead protease